MLRKCAHFEEPTDCAHLALTVDQVDDKVSLVSALPPVHEHRCPWIDTASETGQLYLSQRL